MNIKRALYELVAGSVPGKKKRAAGSISESSVIGTEAIIRRLSGFDAVSFDIFDTLVFRPFSNPKDLFYIVGRSLEYPDFYTVRVNAERTARLRLFEKSGTYEADINDIYSVVEEMTGISADMGIAAETDAELKLCRTNPFIKKIYDELVRRHRKIVITTDMYLKKETIARILSRCGCGVYEKLYVSCEEKAGKHDGKIWKKIKNDFPPRFRFVHIGDNPVSDIISAGKKGFRAVYYPNINIRSRRDPAMTPLIGSAYEGIVNSGLRCGLNIFSPQYEYGYICGGLLVSGFCSYIHKIAVQKNADTVLFFRDSGQFIKQVYDKLYPEEKQKCVFLSDTSETYFLKAVSDSKRVIAAGCRADRDPALLRELAEYKQTAGTDLYGVFVGNTGYTAENETLFSCYFSAEINKKLSGIYRTEPESRVYFETLLCDTYPASTKNTDHENGGYYRGLIDEIHRGAADFSAGYAESFGDFPYMLDISCQDAFAPFKMCAENNFKLPKYVFNGQGSDKKARKK